MPRWTLEARLRQSEKIKQWKPWESSTGPRTAEGKAIASKNRSGGTFLFIPAHGLERSDTVKGQRIERAIAKNQDAIEAHFRLHREFPLWFRNLLNGK